MTLHPSNFPTHFEGEIMCQIDWDNDDMNKHEIKSVHTNTNANENTEYLFLRLKKRSKIVRLGLSYILVKNYSWS